MEKSIIRGYKSYHITNKVVSSQLIFLFFLRKNDLFSSATDLI